MPGTELQIAKLSLRFGGSWWVVVVATVTTACAASSAELPAAPPVELLGMLPASAETLRAAVTEQQQEPNDAQSNGHLAMLLHAHDRPQAASAYYARARALDNDTFRWAYLHGLCLETLGETEAALQALRRAVTIDPNYVPAVLKLAGMLLANGDNRDSGELLGRAVETHPARADAQFSWGRWLLSNDRAADAIAPLLEALRINGHFAEGHYLLVAAFRETGSAEQALQHQALFEQYGDSKLLVADPKRLALNALNTTDRPYLLTANEMIQAGRYEAAIAQYVRAAETNPSRMVTHTNLIMLYGRTGDVSNARKHYEAAMAINPEDPQLHFQYGNLMLAQRQFDDAARHFERSLAADPTFANAWAQLGEARDALRDRPAATDAYREALKIDPNHRQANYRYGRHLVLHDVAYAEALDHMARALEPEDATTVLVLHAMAGIYAVQNRFEDAVATLERARSVSRRHGAPPNLVARIDAELARFRTMLNN
jgi:tetratricopeptide (TPR) repeat protein